MATNFHSGHGHEASSHAIETTTNSNTSSGPATPTTAASASEASFDWSKQTDGTKIIQWDPYLAPFADALRKRYKTYQDKKAEIEHKEGSLDKFSRGYEYYGFTKQEPSAQFPNGGIWFREWLPSARQVYLIGDFNDWHRERDPLHRNEFGVWSIFLPNFADGTPRIRHNTKVKLFITGLDGAQFDRIPAWIKFAYQENANPFLDSVYWDPPQPHVWKHPIPPAPKDLRIYECHVGMSSTEPKISSYLEFARDVLPMIKDMGYNAIQLMAIMEHSYYASFGYQVTNFFAISSRFGTPEELKCLIDTAHSLGLVVLLDIIHSHASKNTADGLNMLDGTDHQYFHGGGKGYHPIWDSRLFNYGNWETLRFLMSNARWFIDEYHFDGFRFDGVTSMLYTHHGVAHAFVNGYDEYFNTSLVDAEAVLYLMLVNDMLHNLRPAENRVITIAEDVSGLAGLCRPLDEGGCGFDYRLAMGIPDKWIELLSKVKDDDWSMGNIAYTLNNRRYMEANIAYAESHDQSLVGDKTIAFWLMDKEMYTNMSILQEPSEITARGIALHKMIRLITCGLGGEGYLNFMGNEFGHPEWVDFPREGNGNSYHYARRRFDLMKDPLLRYQHLAAFDRAMNHLEAKYKWLPSPSAYISCKHEDDKIIAFERAGLVWIFCFHHSKSFPDYRIGVSKPGKYKIVMDSDLMEYGGFKRITKHDDYFSQPIGAHGFPQSLQVYIPCRTAIIFAKED